MAVQQEAGLKPAVILQISHGDGSLWSNPLELVCVTILINVNLHTLLMKLLIRVGWPLMTCDPWPQPISWPCFDLVTDPVVHWGNQECHSMSKSNKKASPFSHPYPTTMWSVQYACNLVASPFKTKALCLSFTHGGGWSFVPHHRSFCCPGGLQLC